MSYNLLASKLAHFDYAKKEVLAFDYRYPRILAEIEQSGADILCLQEVDQLWVYEPEFQALGFDFIPFSRDCEKPVGGPYFTPAICVRRERFKIIEHREVKGNQVCEKYDDGSKDFKQFHKEMFRKPGYIMLCLVEEIDTGK